MNLPVGSRLLAALLCASALFTVAAASLPCFNLAGTMPIVNSRAAPQPSRAPMPERIGPPNRRLRAAVWIYYRCRAIDLPSVADDGAGLGGAALSAMIDLGGAANRPRSTRKTRNAGREKAQKAQELAEVAPRITRIG
ncbi:hypothetical protein Oter_0355 [Opitutus terrae PB90-1]|uniref:Uncharacterized protein n=1 Tax=Opitutus terrae (strain DSM 11246 / JCM 15787 / PB90-1) TaxID=452637 RepID=B1ZQX8_OPITP|nr:hypothetical protein Oter_0355 [Opitutus terrae PB90-1]